MKDLTTCKPIKQLSVFQKNQKEYILNEYPMLDEMIVDTIVRLSKKQRDSIVSDMKDGTLTHEASMKPEAYTLKSVSVE